ncbi:MAG: universal stress protein [Arcobacteraceae bacterium]
MKKKVLVCVDGSLYSKSACEYGVFIAKMLDIPLILLNVVEHPHTSKNIDLSGNIGLGTRDTLLEELTNEEAQTSKTLIANGRKVLQELSVYAKEQGLEKIHTLQRHGNVDETVEELSFDAKIAIIGLRSEKTTNNNITIGRQVESIVRTLTVPILLVNAPFKPIHSILMAYDGSDFANKAINTATQNPIFPNVVRHIVNVNKEEMLSQKLLTEAKNIFSKAQIDVQTSSLKGDAVEALLEYQEKHGLDIIAMGAYSHNALRSAIFGSFTSKMLLNAKTPLLLFR